MLILRDCHGENLLRLSARQGLARVGLPDFHLARMRQPEYDPGSLLQDERRDASPATKAVALARFAAQRGLKVADIRASHVAMGTIRTLRIIGIFASLCLTPGKIRHLTFLPRVRVQFRNLAGPALSEIRAFCDRFPPPPTPEDIQRIVARCHVTSP